MMLPLKHFTHANTLTHHQQYQTSIYKIINLKGNWYLCGFQHFSWLQWMPPKIPKCVQILMSAAAATTVYFSFYNIFFFGFSKNKEKWLIWKCLFRVRVYLSCWEALIIIVLKTVMNKNKSRLEKTQTQ